MGARTRSGWLATVVMAVGFGLVVAGMWGPDGAGAANVNVNVGSGGLNRFTPEDISINVGDTVTFTHVSGTHNVTFVGFVFNEDITSGNPQETTPPFNADATYYYYCNRHAGATDANAQGLAGNEMVGRVIVGDGGPTPTNTPTRTPTNTTVAMSPTATNTQGAPTATVTQGLPTATNTLGIPTATTTQGVPTATGTVPSTPGEYRSFAPNASRQ